MTLTEKVCRKILAASFSDLPRDAVLVPAALAVCERVGASGPDLILAYATGFEMIARLGRELLPGHYEHGWHSTSALGVMGAAASAGKILGPAPSRISGQ